MNKDKNKKILITLIDKELPIIHLPEERRAVIETFIKQKNSMIKETMKDMGVRRNDPMFKDTLEELKLLEGML